MSQEADDWCVPSKEPLDLSSYKVTKWKPLLDSTMKPPEYVFISRIIFCQQDGNQTLFFFHSENPLQTRADISSLFNFSLFFFFFSSSSLMLSASVILFMRKCTHQKWLLTGNALQSPLRLWWSRSSVAELHSVSVESVRWRPRGRDGRPGIMQHVAGDFKNVDYDWFHTVMLLKTFLLKVFTAV